MRERLDAKLLLGRIKQYLYKETENTGAFRVVGPNKQVLLIIVSVNQGWEHCSVSVPGVKRTPTWEEMCWVKDAVWRSDETVVQFHPKKSQYINNHPHVLHLWKKVGEDAELPPKELV